MVLSRDPRTAAKRLPVGCDIAGWDPCGDPAGWERAFADTDAVVNLCGSSVGAWPWTAGRRRGLVESRLRATAAIVDALRRSPREARPGVLVSASGTDAYEGRDAEPATEKTPPATSFLAALCVSWEAAAQEAEPLGIRVVTPRCSLVVSREAPALRRMTVPVRLFVGGPIGTGCQWISWVHVDDAVGLILWAMDRPDIVGPVNVAAPDPRRQAEFVRALGQVLHRPTIVTMPAWMVRLGLGEQATLLLGSRRVWPERALHSGYGFRYPRLEGALKAAVGHGAG